MVKLEMHRDDAELAFRMPYPLYLMPYALRRMPYA